MKGYKTIVRHIFIFVFVSVVAACSPTVPHTSDSLSVESVSSGNKSTGNMSRENAVAWPLEDGDSESFDQKIAASATGKRQLTATILSIDHNTRKIRLKGPLGEEVEFIASEQAKNISHIQAGDVIDAQYTQHVNIMVVKAGDVVPGVTELVAETQATEDEVAGAAIVGSEIQSFLIEEINIKKNTFKLKDAKGIVTEYLARDPKNLTKAEVGDSVLVSLTEALMISVETMSESLILGK